MRRKYKLKYCEKLIDGGLTKFEIIPLLKTRSSRNKNYWIERGYSEDEAKKMANSRCPGTIEYYTIFKNKSLEQAKVLSSEYQKNKSNTEENFIKKYGLKLGKEKWNSYCEKHKIKNTFEYKNEKFGWTKEDFDHYNKSRSVTLENLIVRHGEIKGRELWTSYRERQSYTKSQSYIVEKYGQDEWERLCKVKSHTYESFLERNCGNIERAVEQYNEYCKSVSKRMISSKIADQFFLNLIEQLLNTEYKQYYCNIHNQEWFINMRGSKCIFLDFFLRETGKVVEFYGDYWHANPDKYQPNSSINLRSGGIKKVEEVWECDRLRLETIKKVPYIKGIKVVWESEYRNDPNKVINETIDYLTK